MYIRALYFVLAVRLFGCQSSDSCPQDAVVNEQFNDRIERISSIVPNQVIGSRQLLDIFTLTNITKVKSQVSFGDVSVYASKEDLLQDIAKWRTWVQNNKCEIDGNAFDQIDSIILANESWLSLPPNN